jgi:hypothetical protein
LFDLFPVRFESIDRLDKGGVFACHDHLDGVEVLFTAKASGQVGFWMGGCLKLAAQGTEKPELTVIDLDRHFQIVRYQGGDGDMIAQLKQLVWGKAFHGSSLPGWLSGSWVLGGERRAEAENLPGRRI